jgi:phosphate-selective porin OprO/OprP
VETTHKTTHKETGMTTKTASACLLGMVGLLGASLSSAPLAAQDDGMQGDEQSLEARVAELEAVLAEKPAADAAPGWDFKWSNGFKLTSPDGDLAFKFGGRIQDDWAWYSADDELEAAVGTFEDGTEFRRARLFFEGELYERVEFKAQYDFAGGDADFKDVYLGLVNLPVVGGFRVGQFKEPFSLEELTSSKYVTFLERALPVEAFAPSRNAGFMLHRGEERYTWAVGAFRPTDDFGDAKERDEVNLTGRVTGLPWVSEDGSRLLHLGIALSEREPTADSIRFRSRPESHLAPRVVDTGSFGADGSTLVGLESALVLGPLSFQGEYMQGAVDSLDGSDPELDGFYVYGSWFLTGEHRPYKRSEGAFDRLKPGHPWGEGPGAWELAVRFSSLDLTDATVDGGSVDDVTVALNWYPFANVAWKANYVRSDRDDLGQVDTFQMRFQVDF